MLSISDRAVRIFSGFLSGCTLLTACGLEQDLARFKDQYGNDPSAASTEGAEASTHGPPSGSGTTDPATMDLPDSTDGLDADTADLATETAVTGSSTDSDTPVTCGNQQLDPGEECDGHDAFCMEDCRRMRRVFVTSTNISFDGFFGDFAGQGKLDDGCNDLATAAMLQPEGAARFMAWVSLNGADAADRFRVQSDVPYVLTDGTRVAEDFADLLDGDDLLHPISLDEYGEHQAGDVWTGTRPDGTAADGTDANCNNWTSGDIFDTGLVGDCKKVSLEWTFSLEDTGKRSCGAQRHLYCFEQEIADPEP